jgi:hypothetical protein
VREPHASITSITSHVFLKPTAARRALALARSSALAQIALALETDSHERIKLGPVEVGAPANPQPRALRARAAAPADESPAAATRQVAGKGKRGGGARKRPKVVAITHGARLRFTREDAQRVQAAAERMQAIADVMMQRLDEAESAAPAVHDVDVDAVSLDLVGAIEHLRELSARGIDLVVAPATPTIATPAEGYELITNVAAWPQCRPTQLGLTELTARAAAADAGLTADHLPSPVGDAAWEEIMHPA